MKLLTIYLILLAFLSLNILAQQSIDIKVYLEGPFHETEMNTWLNPDFIPAHQPFNTSPWNYSGTEEVASVPSPDIIDWVLVELRVTSGGASTATSDKSVNRQAAFLKKDGSIVDLDGSSLITYPGNITGNLFIVIWHRNHLAIMSSGPLTESGGIYSWDFTGQLSKAYRNGQKLIASGIYGMIGGDSDGNGLIDMIDKDPNWVDDAGKQGYYGADLNLDSQVNNPDKDNIWELNLGLDAQLPIPFVCGNQFTDDRDNQEYNTVLSETNAGWLKTSISE
jgi:hypothetical protein